MPAYLIAFVDIRDRARFAKEYVPAVGRIIAVSDEARTLEGAVPPGRTAMIEFPDLGPRSEVVRVRRLRSPDRTSKSTRDNLNRRSSRRSHRA